MDLLVKEAFPYKSVAYVYHYLSIYYSFSALEKTKYFFPVFTLILLKILQYLVLFLWDRPLSTFWQIALNDFARLAHLPINFYLLLIGFALLTTYYLYVHFFNQIFAVDFISDVLGSAATATTAAVEKEEEEEGGRYQNKLPSLLQFNFKAHKELPVGQYTAKFWADFLRTWRPFIVFMDLMVVGISQFYMIKAILAQMPTLSTAEQLSLLLLTELNLLSFYLLWRAFFYSMMVLSSISFPLLELFRLMLAQLKETVDVLLKESEGGLLAAVDPLYEEPERRVVAKATFRRQYTKVVVLLSHCSSSYVGRIFMPYLLLNSTANAVLLTTLLSSHSLSLIGQILVICFCLDETQGIFQVHLLLARLNSRLKRLAILYCFAHTSVTTGPAGGFGNNGNNHGRINRRRRQFSLAGLGLSYSQHLHQQLCSWLFIESFAITTNRVYGFKYRQFGQISTLNYCKYCLLYTELIMFVFKNYLKF